MKLLIVDNLEPQDSAFNKHLRDCVLGFVEVENVNYKEVPSANLLDERYDAVVISGSPLHYSNDVVDSRLPFMQWIPETKLPVLAICLGHQNLARLYHGELIVDSEQENGLYPLEVLLEDPLLEDIKSGDLVSELHRVSVALPPGFKQLASTASCGNQIMKHLTKPIYGVQFHPEHSQAGHRIIFNFIQNVAKRVN